MTKLMIPLYAKAAAAEGLRARELFSNKPGLDAAQAAKLGINSGVERAKQIIREAYLEDYDLRSMSRFYARFRNFHSPRAEVAILLWGGRQFLEEVQVHVATGRVMRTTANIGRTSKEE